MHNENNELEKILNVVENQKKGKKGNFKSFLDGLKYVTIVFLFVVLLAFGTYIILRL